MSFVYDLADTRYKTQVFYSSGNWVKPRGITMVSITAIGAGGGGAAGTAVTRVGARTGGGGGGSGSITRLIIPEMFISDSLVIVIGQGGTGGVSSGGAGVNGGATYVDMPVPGGGATTLPFPFTRIVTTSGGTAGTGAFPGAGGSAALVGDAIYSNLGIWVALAGQSGSDGTTANGNNVSYATLGVPLVGGAGGGGMIANGLTPTNGGDMTGVAQFVPTIIGGASGGNGNKGSLSITPFYTLGGSGGGGGGDTPASGGRGGDGAPGCGGGGGGGGTTPTGVGGTGGKGGDGLVIITCW